MIGARPARAGRAQAALGAHRDRGPARRRDDRRHLRPDGPDPQRLQRHCRAVYAASTSRSTPEGRVLQPVQHAAAAQRQLMAACARARRARGAGRARGDRLGSSSTASWRRPAAAGARSSLASSDGAVQPAPTSRAGMPRAAPARSRCCELPPRSTHLTSGDRHRHRDRTRRRPRDGRRLLRGRRHARSAAPTSSRPARRHPALVRPRGSGDEHRRRRRPRRRAAGSSSGAIARGRAAATLEVRTGGRPPPTRPPATSTTRSAASSRRRCSPSPAPRCWSARSSSSTRSRSPSPSATREFALLRSLGATRRQILAASRSRRSSSALRASLLGLAAGLGCRERPRRAVRRRRLGIPRAGSCSRRARSRRRCSSASA